MELKLFVRNLSYAVTESELRQLFEKHGEVASIDIPTDRATGRSRGFGFVEMNSKADAEHAIDALNNQEFAGRTLFVAVSQPKEKFLNTSDGPRSSR